MYSEEEIRKALEVYEREGSLRKANETLGYPSIPTLAMWVRRQKSGEKVNQEGRPHFTNNVRRHKYCGAEEKMEVLKRCFEGESPEKLAAEYGVAFRTIYNWKEKYLSRDGGSRMNSAEKKKRKQNKEAIDPTIAALLARIEELELDVDILTETVKVLKKDPGVVVTPLRNKEKVVITDALREKHSLPTLLKKLDLPKSSYYYERKRLQVPDKYESVRRRIQEIFKENRSCYGYRRVKAVLAREGLNISEKVVRRLMREEGLQVQQKRRRRYSSFQGDLEPHVPNLLKRDFKAEKPREKWVTDITEFKIPAGKAYLSVVVDCYDGYVVGWSVGKNPTSELANSSLRMAVATLGTEKPYLHSDRGIHYFWPGWLKLVHKYGLKRSMSKKGCTPDNAACEGFFGRLKNECFYNHSFQDVSLTQFMAYIDDYIRWYNQDRIKISLNNLSPLDYRRAMGFAA